MRGLGCRHPDEVGASSEPLMDWGHLLGELQTLIVLLTRIENFLFPFVHPDEIVKSLVKDSGDLVVKVWFGFVLQTTDLESTRDFTKNATVRAFEPKVQVVANSALALMAVWAAYRIMWGHGLRSLYTARVLLPRLLMSVVLVNFALPLMQAVIDPSHTVTQTLSPPRTIPHTPY